MGKQKLEVAFVSGVLFPAKCLSSKKILKVVKINEGGIIA